MPAKISCRDFFAIHDRITAKIAEAGDNLRKLLANKLLLEQLKPVAVDVDRELQRMQDEMPICNEEGQNGTVGPLGSRGSTQPIVSDLARLTLDDTPEVGSLRYVMQGPDPARKIRNEI